MLTSLFFGNQQAARRVEDDVAGVAKTVAENYEDEELKKIFLDLIVQL